MILEGSTSVVFGDINYTPNFHTPPSQTYITNATYDEVRVDYEDIPDPVSLSKKEWGGQTLLLANFEKDSLNSGSLDADIKDITHILLKKKRENDNQWVTIDKVEYKNLIDGTYSFVDKNADPAEKYEYAVVPCSGSKEYNYYIKNVVTEMDTCYIYDRDHRYELYYDFSFDDFGYVMPSETIETMGRKYPIVVYNNVLNYADGGISCLLYAGQDGEIDYVNEKRLRTEIMDFLTNRKPKAIKSYEGTNMMIAIVGKPSLSPSARGIYNLSFEFVEIGDMNNQNDLYENNFVDIPVEGGVLQ